MSGLNVTIGKSSCYFEFIICRGNPMWLPWFSCLFIHYGRATTWGRPYKYNHLIPSTIAISSGVRLPAACLLVGRVGRAVEGIDHLVNLFFEGGGVGIGVFLFGGEDLVNKCDNNRLILRHRQWNREFLYKIIYPSACSHATRFSNQAHVKSYNIGV